jgi:predicted small integral membrane protein
MDGGTRSLFAWMAWTTPVAVLFAAIALLLIVMTICEIRSPTVARRGLLPLVTTRGDRLFIGLLLTAWVNLAWAGLTDWSQWGGLAAGLVAAGFVMRFG